MFNFPRTVDFVCAVGLILLRREGNAAKIQLISDLCDLAVPLSALGYVTLDDGIVGLSGTVSSLLGLWSVWKKTA